MARNRFYTRTGEAGLPNRRLLAAHRTANSRLPGTMHVDEGGGKQGEECRNGRIRWTRPPNLIQVLKRTRMTLRRMPQVRYIR